MKEMLVRKLAVNKLINKTQTKTSQVVRAIILGRLQGKIPASKDYVLICLVKYFLLLTLIRTRLLSHLFRYKSYKGKVDRNGVSLFS